ncbi:MAG: tRNA (guanosine(37)-N1)-methyltransferase TrmD [Acidobacteria bacterium]|nr:tRNA (guanosine(37)-N1)-methyltransferase TrmD [Acidobacteriota bacterium]
MLRFDVITIFPNFFESPHSVGVVGRAFSSGIAVCHTHDLRSWTHDRHRTVDDRPFGGGEGMVMKPEPIFAAVESLNLTSKLQRDSKQTVILLSAQGERFTQSVAHDLAQMERIVLICGRYEGVDERVSELLCDRELSVGDYVLSGGELGAAIIIDAVVRLRPGVLGNADSARFESFGHHDASLPLADLDAPRAVHGSGGLLDYPHYTRPVDFRGHTVPEVLTGGDHALIRKWRRQQALRKTERNRPDLLEKAELSAEDMRLLGEELD